MVFLDVAIVVVYVFICVFLILVVLVQQGKGADIAGAFGGGGTQTAFGARGATTLLHKLTTGAFIAFILLSLVLTIRKAGAGPSVMETVPKKAATEKSAPKSPPAPAPAVPAPQAAPPATQSNPAKP